MENLSENYKSKFHGFVILHTIRWPHFLKINLKSRQLRNFQCLGRNKGKKGCLPT